MRRILPGANAPSGMKKLAALLLLFIVAACDGPPPSEPARAVETKRQAISFPGDIAGTLKITRRIQHQKYWDGVLAGAWSPYSSDAAPPAASIQCPRMWVAVARWMHVRWSDGTQEDLWEDNQYNFLTDPTSIKLDSEGFYNGPSSGPVVQYCNYTVCKPGTSLAAGNCAPLDLKGGDTYVWMTPACPGNPNRGVGGIAEFDGRYIFIGRDPNHQNTPYAQTMADTWNGPFGAKKMWRDFASQCGYGPGPKWSAPTDLKITWCDGVNGRPPCLPMSTHVANALWQ